MKTVLAFVLATYAATTLRAEDSVVDRWKLEMDQEAQRISNARQEAAIARARAAAFSAKQAAEAAQAELQALRDDVAALKRAKVDRPAENDGFPPDMLPEVKAGLLAARDRYLANRDAQQRQAHADYQAVVKAEAAKAADLIEQQPRATLAAVDASRARVMAKYPELAKAASPHRIALDAFLATARDDPKRAVEFQSTDWPEKIAEEFAKVHPIPDPAPSINRVTLSDGRCIVIVGMTKRTFATELEAWRFIDRIRQLSPGLQEHAAASEK